MKPIIIIKETNKDGKFELTEKELKELIEQAYKQGFEDGEAQYPSPTIPYWAEHREPIPCDNNKINNPHDIYGNPIPYCGGTTVSDPRDHRATLTQEIKVNGSAVSTGV